MRLTVEIIANSPEEERLQRIWLRYMEREGLLGALLQAAWQCEATSNDVLEQETGGAITAAEVRALYPPARSVSA